MCCVPRIAPRIARIAPRRQLVLLAVVLFLCSCQAAERVVSEVEFKKMPSFEATVLESRPIRFENPSARRHSARIEDYRVRLRMDDGSVLVVDRVFRDANWPWVAKDLTEGKKYTFPKAMYDLRAQPADGA